MLRLLGYLFFAFLVSSCGGSGSDSEKTNIIPPPAVTTTPLYGVFNLTLDDNNVRTVLLDAERSYLFSVANNSTPPQELMCISEEPLYEFSDTQKAQTLNFNCSGSVDETLSLTIELSDEILITYTHSSEYNLIIAKEEVVEIVTPNFRNLSTGSYITPVRDDINISRYIVASPRIPTYIDFNIFSRDWPTGGHCLASLIYRVSDIASITVNETSESVSAPYSQTPIFSNSGCSQKMLPMPSSSEPLSTHIYTLADSSYFLAFEQLNFVTMGRLYLSE